MARAPAAYPLNVFGPSKVGLVLGLLPPAGLRGGLAGLAAFGLTAVVLGGAMIRARDKGCPAVKALAGGRRAHGRGKGTPAYRPVPAGHGRKENPKRKKTFCVEGNGKKRPKPEEEPSARPAQRIHVQIGRIRPILDRSPHLSYHTTADDLQAAFEPLGTVAKVA